MPLAYGVFLMLTLRPYQTAAVESIFEYFGSGASGNPVIAMPTATGKSIVIADFIRRSLMQWPAQRFVMATHVKELIEQNTAKMLDVWPTAPLGIYSAGLNRKEYTLPIVFGSIQSMRNSAAKLGHRDLLIIDECHLLSAHENTNYMRFITALKAINPKLKVIGLSATPYRMGQGLVTDGGLFTDICYDITSLENFNRLIDEGWICTLIPKRTNLELNTSDVKIQAGDYVQHDLQKAVDKDRITYAACKEMVEQASDRHSWLVFASGIEHSNHIASTLSTFGIAAYSVHSKITDDERNKALAQFRSGELRCIVNNNVLTTGFDHPHIDMIGMLRPTTSTGLWVQMLGRGTRPAPFKQNCLVLDFAGNTKRLGCINDPVIPKKKGSKGGMPPIRICEACGTYNHARAIKCIHCGAAFEIATKITKHADTAELIRATVEPVYETFDVKQVFYNRHTKIDARPIIKVSYLCGLKMFSEYVCIEHPGYAGRKAREWWAQRINIPCPHTTDEALSHIRQFRQPKQIRVWLNRTYPEILGVVF